MSNILITGAAGFIGSHLAERLLNRGDTVIGLDNFADNYDPAIKRRNLSEAKDHPKFTFTEGDICDKDDLFQVFERAKPEVVVHLAARAGVRPSLEDPNLYHRVNIIGTQNILDACREYKPSHLVAASSSSVYGGLTDVPFDEAMDVSRPVSPYAATKRMNELMAHVYHHVYGLNITMLRFFTVYGPRQRPDMAIHKFARLIADGKPIPMFGDGTTARDYTYIDDIIDGVEHCVDKPFPYEIFNLGESRHVQLRELIDKLGEAMGITPEINCKPMQPGDVEITFANIDKARTRLGYAPQVSIEEGLARFIEWFKENQAANPR